MILAWILTLIYIFASVVAISLFTQGYSATLGLCAGAAVFVTLLCLNRYLVSRVDTWPRINWIVLTLPWF